MSISLNRDKRKKTGKRYSIGDFHWDEALKSFACLRLDTAYAVSQGKKNRPYGYKPKLEAELNAFAQRYNIPLPSGSTFVTNMVTRVDREADSEIMKKYKAAMIEYAKVNRADPAKRECDRETKKMYNSSKRAKEIHRNFVTNKGMKELGIPWPVLPHIIDYLQLKNPNHPKVHTQSQEEGL